MADSTILKNVEYAADLQHAEETKKCIFCQPQWGTRKDGTPRPVLGQSGRWKLYGCDYPAKGAWNYEDTKTKGITAKNHFLIICDDHVHQPHQLVGQDFFDSGILALQAFRDFNIPGGMVGVRLGATAPSGLTIMHAHVHVIEPGINPETGVRQPIAFWVGWNVAE